MFSLWFAIRDWILGHGYRFVVKPIYFRFDPEQVHHALTQAGVRLSRTKIGRGITHAAFYYQHPILKTTVAGMSLRSPIGLAAGFDKEGVLTDILPELGFGFATVGSVTGSPCPGNPKPRLWRLPKSKALLVHLGLNSSGGETIGQRLVRQPSRIPRGISIARANISSTDSIAAGIADYVLAAKQMQNCGAYWEINISCPNTTGGEPFVLPEHLTQLLTALQPYISNQPSFIKVPSNLTHLEYDALIRVAHDHHITGWICTNLLKDHHSQYIVDANVPPKGGISGKVLQATADDVLRYMYQQTQGRMPIIGVGGVFTAEDAYKKIRHGATAIQLITGMIYRGPSVLSEIQRGLVRLLRRDGFTSIEQAVGVDAK